MKLQISTSINVTCTASRLYSPADQWATDTKLQYITCIRTTDKKKLYMNTTHNNMAIQLYSMGQLILFSTKVAQDKKRKRDKEIHRMLEIWRNNIHVRIVTLTVWVRTREDISQCTSLCDQQSPPPIGLQANFILTQCHPPTYAFSRQTHSTPVMDHPPMTHQTHSDQCWSRTQKHKRRSTPMPPSVAQPPFLPLCNVHHLPPTAKPPSHCYVHHLPPTAKPPTAKLPSHHWATAKRSFLSAEEEFRQHRPTCNVPIAMQTSSSANEQYTVIIPLNGAFSRWHFTLIMYS